jgi:tetratricopeptide (TPR) repeat protein
MLLRRDYHLLRGTALAIVLATGAASQTTLETEQLDAGQQLRAHGRYNEARTVFANLLRDVNSGKSGSRVAGIVLDNAGINETHAGNYAAAETAFNQSLTLLHESPTGDPIMAAVKTHLSELYIAEQRPQDAEPLLRQAAASIRSNVHTDGVALSEIYDNLAVVCGLLRKRGEAEMLLRNSTAILEKQVGPDNPRFADPLLTYAGLLVVEHHYTNALVPAERAWQILRKSDGVADSYLAGAACILASVYYHLGRNADAESYARKAIELGESAFGPDHPQVASYLANYAVILKRRDRKEAKEVQERADAIRARSTSDSLAGYTVVADALIR